MRRRLLIDEGAPSSRKYYAVAFAPEAVAEETRKTADERTAEYVETTHLIYVYL